MTLCACGEEIEARFAFCPFCGLDLRWSAEVRGTPGMAATRSLCRTLRACATRTFERLAFDHFEGVVPNEETYTELNLQDLGRLHGDRVTIRAFKTFEESRNGADWEWWFHSGDVGFGMRVQAKRAKRGGGYTLEHRIRSTGELQSQLLVQDALANGCIPAYVLYNHRNWVAASEAGKALDCRHGRGEEAQLGCTVVSALTVHAVLRRSPIRAAYVRDQSMPWHRLLCDAPATGMTGLEAAYGEVRQLHARGVGDLRETVRAEARWVPDPATAYPQSRERTVRREDERVTANPETGSQPMHIHLPEPDYEAFEREVLGTPVYRGMDAVSPDVLSPLPARVVDMIRGRQVQPPDERVGGAVLVDLSDATPARGSVAGRE